VEKFTSSLLSQDYPLHLLRLLIFERRTIMSEVWVITGAGSGIGAWTATADSKRLRAQNTCTRLLML
jgi:hypothetical protein